MIMDILILGIFSTTIFLSMRKGFAMTVANFFKGVVTLIIAWIFCDDVSAFLTEKTFLGTKISETIQAHLTAKWEDSDMYKALPDLLKAGSDHGTGDLISEGAASLTAVLMTIFSFVLIVLVLRLAVSLFIHLFSHKENEGFTGAMDWFLGTLLGVILGIISVMLFLAVVLPLVGILMPGQLDTVTALFQGSFFAEDLYDNNLLLILFRDFAL